MWHVVVLLAVGLGVGFAGGTLGAGGGFVLVPVLYTLLGWPLIAAVATSHFCGLTVSASASGTYAGARLIDWRLGVIMQAATVIGAAAGAYVASWISVPLVAVLFCLVSVFSAVRMWVPQRSDDDDRTPRPAPGRFLLALPAMTLVGAASAILGLGGGVFMVPIMTTFLKVPMRRAVATSIFIVGLNAASAAAVYYVRGNVQVLPTGLLASGVLVGALIGSSLQHRLPVIVLRRAFAAILVFLAVRLALRALG